MMHSVKFYVPIFLLGMLIALPVFATVPFDYSPIRERRFLKPYSLISKDSILSKRYNYLAEFVEIADFLTDWQVEDTTNADFGGMIEAEGGHLGGIIQTDNTLEAIWVWSRYAEFTGDSIKYSLNIKRAWVYCEKYPAWEEEGALGMDYYRVHNSAWGLLASETYYKSCGDTTYNNYGRTCADYIKSHPLSFSSAYPSLRLINPFVTGLAAGNLYLYAKEKGDDMGVDTALAYGERLIDWVAENPASRLGDEIWALSSGTVAWGICNSVFREDTTRGKNWIADNGGHVDTFQEWYNRSYDSFDWDNAWNVAFCNAHYAMYEISGNLDYKKNHKFLTNLLLSYDTDADGGIQASTQDPDTEDMTWITSYLALKGLHNIIGTPPDIDAGILRFVSPQDGEEYDEITEIVVEVSNFGLSDIDEMWLKIGEWREGCYYEDSVPISNLEFVETIQVSFLIWVPMAPGTYTLCARTICEGDSNPENDTLCITFYVTGEDIAEENPKSEIRNPKLAISPNPFSDKTVIELRSFGVQEFNSQLFNSSTPQLKIYDLSGRLMRTLTPARLTNTSHKLVWDGTDNEGEKVKNSIYFIQVKTGEYKATKKLILMR